MLLNVNEVAKNLNVNQSWVRYKVFRKEIPFIKVGRHVRFELEEVAKWIKQSQEQKGGGK